LQGPRTAASAAAKDVAVALAAGGIAWHRKDKHGSAPGASNLSRGLTNRGVSNEQGWTSQLVTTHQQQWRQLWRQQLQYHLWVAQTRKDMSRWQNHAGNSMWAISPCVADDL
jgi:hypothetical protein